MSNFKEFYPQKNFREDLHRMDSLGNDNYEVWAYNGDPDFAPLSADYSYELVKKVKTVSGKDIKINDAIHMPLESFKLYGKSSQIQTTGNQLVDFNDWPSSASLDYIFENDIIDVIGKTSEKYPSSSISITTLYKANPGKVLCFDFEELTVTNRSGTIVQLNINHSGGNTTYHSLVNGSKNKTPWTIPNDVSDVTSVRLCIYPNNSATAYQGSVHIVKPTLQFGTDKRPYEPYTNGLPAPIMSNPTDIKYIGTWNPSTNYYEIKCYNNYGLNLITNASIISLQTTNGGSKTSAPFTFDSSFTLDNFKGKTVTMSFNSKSANATPNSSSDRHRWGGEFSWKKTDNTTNYNGIWVELPNHRKDGRYSQAFTIPDNWDGNFGERNFYIQRLATGEIKLWDMKLELGNKATPFSLNPADPNYSEPGKESIYSPQPLSSLQNGVRDYYDNGYLYLSTVYDWFRPNDNWEIERALTNNNVLVASLFIPNGVKTSTDIYCTHFRASEDLSQPNRIKIDNQRIYISVDATEFPGLDNLLRWMQENTVFVLYQRKNTLKVSSQPSVMLYTYEEMTNIVNDQNAEMEVEYRVGPNAKIWQRQEDGTFIELTS